MRWLTAKSSERTWLYGLAGALMIGGPIWRELYHFYYPLRPEVFVLPLVGGIIGALVAVSSRLVGGLVGTVIFGALLFVFADLQFELQRYTYTAAIFAASILLAALLASHRAAMTAIALGAFYITSLVRADFPPRISTDTTVSSSGPVLVHVILDEQWGIGGLRAAGDSATADFLAAFYLDRGFEVYEGAYSRYEYTAQSVPSTLSLGEAPMLDGDRAALPGGPYWRSLRRTPYLERLRALGYHLRVYQSTFLDMCAGSDIPAADCDVQWMNSIGNIGLVGGSWIVRASWAARYFLSNRSHVYARLTPETTFWHRWRATGANAEMQRLASVLADGRQTPTAYLVHALLPHRPIHLDEECRVFTDGSRHVEHQYPTQSSDSLWRVALLAYGSQVRCTHHLLGQVIEAVDNTAGLDNSIIIVHGDHGSRMHPPRLSDKQLAAYSPTELNAGFSTLLAVRRPHVAAALHPYPIPVQDAVWELARSGFADSLSRRWRHEVRAVESQEKEVVRPLTTADMIWVRREN